MLVNVSVDFTMKNVPAFALFMPCMFYAFFPTLMEARSLLPSQNASDLVFSPLEIHLGKAKGVNRKREVETMHNVGFRTPGSTC